MTDKQRKAIEVLKDWDGYFIGHSSDDVNEALNTAIEAIKAQKEAHWVWIRYEYYQTLGDWVCSRCKNEVVNAARKDDVYRMPFYKYCPECGAKMTDVYGKSEEGAKDE